MGLLVTFAVTAGACRRAAPPAAPVDPPHRGGALRGWQMRAELAPGADAVAVQMCFDGAPPRAVTVMNPDATPYVDELRVVGREQALRMRGGRVDLAGMAPGECLGYRVDFRRMASRESTRSISWVGQSVVVRQSMWLLWPSDAPADAQATLELVVPEGLSASVPWPRDGDAGGRRVHRLQETIARWLGYTAFGKLAIERIDAHGTEVELARLDGEMACDDAGLRRWILDAIASTAMLYDGYPRERLQVIVVPVEGGGDSVYFGMAARGGGSGVILLVDRAARAADLPGGWTTVHELLHHGMPFAREAWMGEGFVSYYTELMRTRMGHRSEADGWRELAAAFERGRRGGRGLTLAATSARMMDMFAFQRVYWGGAAIAFEIDVTMRLDSDGKLGLDDAMRELRRCCGDAPRRWPAMTLLGKLDAWYGKPIFTTIAKKHLDRIVFPDTGDLMQKLGVGIDGGAVTLDDRHPAAAIRRAIMAPRK